MDKTIDLTSLEKSIDYRFKNKALLLEALTHKSYKISPDNERLEFLGDAVLDLVVGELLFHKFPQSTEGNLSKMRAGIVNEKGFMRFALELKLGDYVHISQSEEQNQGRNKPSILSDAFEALMGAIYLEAGLNEVKKIIDTLLEKVYPNEDFESLALDYKTSVQELSQAHFLEIPTYKLISESGPDHCKEFEMTLCIKNTQYARAKGKSKKDAQQKCAQIAYEKLKGLL